ncbi:MAG: Fic family protein [Sulfurimonas sp.]|uniref:Fic family protein n=1 Tax=Sulfurimonas sp. TaxID=2022749 RepID=UPI00261F1A70|nr:Fic family protein [Sulfurimonas sp.]MCW8894591.1 Fic family protein [Sulfurimonas sp.]MCW8953796.1 Fic family protein [Sulfurimonas sp.]MCW9068034.1 Fic family protein [Sulfurimonas sp.]
MTEFIPKNLPIPQTIETIKVLKKTISANRALAKLNGVAKIIPNQAILINSLVLQEAKDSSEIENIITTHDELYRASIDISNITNEAKEVQNYSFALLKGFDLVKENHLLLKKYIVKIQEELEQNGAGVRCQSGTNLKNAQTGEVVFTPPQNYETIQNLLDNLEKFINEPNDNDPLVNMAIIHYQFESIHPFYDGNGRTGRIINILYLILKGLLDIPILYLSRYIIKNKNDYYRLLQEVRTKDALEEWILYMLDGVEQTSIETINLVEGINNLMEKTTDEVKEKLPKIYSKDLIEILFMHPYTKIDFLVDKLGITRQTASKYLKELEHLEIMKSIQIKNSKYFINSQLFAMLQKGI